MNLWRGIVVWWRWWLLLPLCRCGTDRWPKRWARECWAAGRGKLFCCRRGRRWGASCQRPYRQPPHTWPAPDLIIRYPSWRTSWDPKWSKIVLAFASDDFSYLKDEEATQTSARKTKTKKKKKKKKNVSFSLLLSVITAAVTQPQHGWKKAKNTTRNSAVLSSLLLKLKIKTKTTIESCERPFEYWSTSL